MCYVAGMKTNVFCDPGGEDGRYYADWTSQQEILKVVVAGPGVLNTEG
jgi:hypothetical protein